MTDPLMGVQPEHPGQPDPGDAPWRRVSQVPFIGGRWHAQLRDIDWVGDALPATVANLEHAETYVLRQMSMDLKRVEDGVSIGSYVLDLYVDSAVGQDGPQVAMDAAMQIMVRTYGRLVEQPPAVNPSTNGHARPSGLIIPGGR